MNSSTITFRSRFFNKVASFRHKCFSVDFAKFLRTQFFTEHIRWLLLNLIKTVIYYTTSAHCSNWNFYFHFIQQTFHYRFLNPVFVQLKYLIVWARRRNCFTQFICANLLNNSHIFKIQINLLKHNKLFSQMFFKMVVL